MLVFTFGLWPVSFHLLNELTCFFVIFCLSLTTPWWEYGNETYRNVIPWWNLTSPLQRVLAGTVRWIALFRHCYGVWMKLSHHWDTEAPESIFCFSFLLRREQRKGDMPFGRVLSFKELRRSAGAFPFLPSLQKRENKSDSVVSVSLAWIIHERFRHE